MKLLLTLLLLVIANCNIYCWEDSPDRDTRDLLSKEEARERTNPNAKASIETDRGIDIDSRSEPHIGTVPSGPDRD